MTREEFIKKYVSSASWGDAAGCIYDYVESKLGQPRELKIEEASDVPDACDHGYITMTPGDYEVEIARRVAEDRRDALCHCQKKLKEARAERDAALAEVERLSRPVDGVEWSRVTPFARKLIEPSIISERNAAQEEIERLLNEVNICRAVLGIKPDEQIPDQEVSYGSILVEKPSGARMRISPINEEIIKLEKEVEQVREAGLEYRRQYDELGKEHYRRLERIAELEARVVEQAEEIERLSRPMDNNEQKELYDYSRFSMCKENRDWIIGLFQRERNARETAEQERGQLVQWLYRIADAVGCSEGWGKVLDEVIAIRQRAETAKQKLENISKIADKAIQCCFEGQDVWAGLESIRREIKK